MSLKSLIFLFNDLSVVKQRFSDCVNTIHLCEYNDYYFLKINECLKNLKPTEKKKENECVFEYSILFNEYRRRNTTYTLSFFRPPKDKDEHMAFLIRDVDTKNFKISYDISSNITLDKYSLSEISEIVQKSELLFEYCQPPVKRRKEESTRSTSDDSSDSEDNSANEDSSTSDKNSESEDKSANEDSSASENNSASEDNKASEDNSDDEYYRFSEDISASEDNSASEDRSASDESSDTDNESECCDETGVLDDNKISKDNILEEKKLEQKIQMNSEESVVVKQNEPSCQ